MSDDNVTMLRPPAESSVVDYLKHLLATAEAREAEGLPIERMLAISDGPHGTQIHTSFNGNGAEHAALLRMAVRHCDTVYNQSRVHNSRKLRERAEIKSAGSEIVVLKRPTEGDDDGQT